MSHILYCFLPVSSILSLWASKARLQFRGRERHVPNSFDQRPCLVTKGKVNSWTCFCWGKALPTFLQAQPTSAWLGEMVLQAEALWGGGSFSSEYQIFSSGPEVSSWLPLQLCWAFTLSPWKTPRSLLRDRMLDGWGTGCWGSCGCLACKCQRLA